MNIREEFNSIFKINDDQVEFVKEKLNYKDKLLIVGVEENEELKDKISKYEYFIEKNSDAFLNNFYKKGKSFKEICFLCQVVKELREIRVIRELSKKIYEQLGVNGYIVLQIINYDKFIIGGNKEKIFSDTEIISPIWKEDLINVLKNIGFVDIEIYGSFDKDNFNEINSNSMIVRARKYEDLLKDTRDYEDYSENVVESKVCGGCCSKKSGGCSSCRGCSKGCNRH